ncbi:hypothetical protein WJX84_008962 [Apatococcus fuscideae]|uniref:Potassium channel tetramerisation-type BTB domain-containing protein n=1 Tax=Apatococcus fuscideae TaxID=2026836 RepID=A0AAW1T7R3_9CHLO
MDTSEKDRCILDDGTQQVSLNVAGHRYTASLRTLRAEPDSHLANAFAGNWRLSRTAAGEVFLDRNGEAFGIVLQYLRARRDSRAFVLPPLDTYKLGQLKVEADFYGLEGLKQLSEAGMEKMLDSRY